MFHKIETGATTQTALKPLHIQFNHEFCTDVSNLPNTDIPALSPFAVNIHSTVNWAQCHKDKHVFPLLWWSIFCHPIKSTVWLWCCPEMTDTVDSNGSMRSLDTSTEESGSIVLMGSSGAASAEWAKCITYFYDKLAYHQAIHQPRHW